MVRPVARRRTCDMLAGVLLATNFRVPPATFADFPKGERFMP
jgi:hypothetical protein